MRKERNLFEYEFRMDKLTKIGDPLLKLEKNLPWENLFKKILKKAFKKAPKGLGGRPAYDYIMMFKVLILQRFYNISDDQMEYQLNDRLTFQRFLGLKISDDVPDATTVWRFREVLTEKGAIKKLFDQFNNYLDETGIVVNEGSIVDASFVDVPRQRNSREENKSIKEGTIPNDWEKKENKNKLAKKDIDARWTKKRNEIHYGYKNHTKAGGKTKLIKKYTVTDASVHDSQELENLLDDTDKEKKIYGDSAYKSKDIDDLLAKRGIKNKIHAKGYRNHPLSEKQKKQNKKKSSIRVRIEHIFGFIENSMGGSFIRSIGKKRAEGIIGLMNLTYNMFRFEQLTRRYA
jgi:IS5 family transposase